MDYLDTRAPEAPHAEAERQVTALYQAHALSLARLALLMLGDRDTAQDVVHGGPARPCKSRSAGPRRVR